MLIARVQVFTMGNGFNNVDFLVGVGHGNAAVLYEKHNGKTNAQKRVEAEVSWACAAQWKARQLASDLP